MGVGLDAVMAVLAGAGVKFEPRLVSVVFATIDQGPIEEASLERVRYEIWNQESPLNGVAAADIKARADYVGGEVYLLFVDDRLTVIQPVAPGVSGLVPMTLEEACGHAGRQVTEIAGQLSLQAVLGRVREVLSQAGVADAAPVSPG